jgi:hypothetical protein
MRGVAPESFGLLTVSSNSQSEIESDVQPLNPMGPREVVDRIPQNFKSIALFFSLYLQSRLAEVSSIPQALTTILSGNPEIGLPPKRGSRRH